MTVQVPRSKLRGSLGHSSQHPCMDFMQSNYLGDYEGAPVNMTGGEELMLPPSCVNFVVNEGVDSVVSHGKSHKS